MICVSPGTQEMATHAHSHPRIDPRENLQIHIHTHTHTQNHQNATQTDTHTHTHRETGTHMRYIVSQAHVRTHKPVRLFSHTSYEHVSTHVNAHS